MPLPGGSETEMAPGAGGDTPTPASKKAAGEEDDKEYLKEMRGWLMTVATLFIGMAFDAALHPPEWFKTEWYTEGPKGWRPFGKHHAAAPSPHAAAAASTRGELLKADFYLASNEVTFGTALAIVLFLLWAPNTASAAKPVLRFASILLTLLCAFVAFTFAMGAASSWGVTWLAFAGALICAALAVVYLHVMAATAAPA